MIDLHYWPTPNGKKVTILLEELGMPYKIVPVNIGRGNQFTPEFLEKNPTPRMPGMVDSAQAAASHAPPGLRSGHLCRTRSKPVGFPTPQWWTCASSNRWIAN